jgi:hypothetical protein
MNDTNLDDQSFFDEMPNHVLAHWLELQVILDCKYDDLADQQRDIDAKRPIFNQYGYDIIRTSEYTEIIKLEQKDIIK